MDGEPDAVVVEDTAEEGTCCYLFFGYFKIMSLLIIFKRLTRSIPDVEDHARALALTDEGLAPVHLVVIDPDRPSTTTAEAPAVESRAPALVPGAVPHRVIESL